MDKKVADIISRAQEGKPPSYEETLLLLELDEASPEATAVRGAANDAGAAVEGQRFVPHLTLARTRTRIEGTRWLGVLDSFGQFEWQATELQVIRSHRGEGPGRRSRYELLAALPLAGGPG